VESPPKYAEKAEVVYLKSKVEKQKPFNYAFIGGNIK
jgi:hypothetical protein